MVLLLQLLLFKVFTIAHEACGIEITYSSELSNRLCSKSLFISQLCGTQILFPLWKRHDKWLDSFGCLEDRS